MGCISAAAAGRCSMKCAPPAASRCRTPSAPHHPHHEVANAAQRHPIEEDGRRYLGEIDAERALTPLQAASCTYRIARGARRAEGAELTSRAAPTREA